MTSPPVNPNYISIRVASHSEEDTQMLGTALGESLTQGAVIALVGDLGAGKTRLVRATCSALSVDPLEVTSPTFVLIHEYEGRLPVYHFDTYRLRDVSEFLDLGADELMNGESVCLIEWADRVAEVLPEDRLEIAISITSATTREFDCTACGSESMALLKRIRACLLSLGLTPIAIQNS